MGFGHSSWASTLHCCVMDRLDGKAFSFIWPTLSTRTLLSGCPVWKSGHPDSRVVLVTVVWGLSFECHRFQGSTRSGHSFESIPRHDQSGTAMTDCREFRPIGVVPGKSIDWHLFQSHGVYEDGFQIENVSSIRFLSSFWQVPDWKPGAALLLVMGHTDIPQLGVLLGFCGWEILGSSKPCLRFLPNLGRL